MSLSTRQQHLAPRSRRANACECQHIPRALSLLRTPQAFAILHDPTVSRTAACGSEPHASSCSFPSVFNEARILRASVSPGRYTLWKLVESSQWRNAASTDTHRDAWV